MRNTTTDTVALFGLPITNVTMAQAVARVEHHILSFSGRTHQIATANLDFARNALRDESLQRIICECSMVLPDGAPMLWAATLLGVPLQERVTGVDLVPELAQLSALRGYSIFLLGSSESNSARAAEVLARQAPGVRIVGRYSPPVASVELMDNEDILRRIAAARPDMLLVAFGNPKQEVWIHRFRDRLKVPVAIGVGGSLDMIAGSLRRAPEWLQTLHMEWIYRMIQEPRRLGPRYFGDALALARYLPLGLAANSMQPGERRHGGLRVEVTTTVRLVVTPARLSGGVCAWLAREAMLAAAEHQHMVLDMSATIRVEADGLGGLLEARRTLLGAGLTLWLTGMSTAVRRVLQFSAMADLFSVAGTPNEAMGLVSGGSIPAGRLSEAVPAFRERRKARVGDTKVAKAS